MNNLEIVQKAINRAIKNKDVKFLCKILFNEEITPLQTKLIRKIAFLESRRICVSAATRWGKSFCVSRGIALYLLMNRDKKVFFLGPKLEQALILREYMTELIFKCPKLFSLCDLEKTKEQRAKQEGSRKRVTFSKINSEYRVFSAEGDAHRLMGHGIGSGGGIIVLDEATLISNDVRAKINRMMADNPQETAIMELFNPWNRESKSFEHINNPNWDYTHIDWRMSIKDGRITKEFIDEQREELTDIEFEVLYESNFPREATDQLIPYWAIHKAIREIPKKFNPDFKRQGVDPAERGTDLTVRIIVGKMKSLHVIMDIKSKSKDEPTDTVIDIENDYKRIPFNETNIDSVGIGSGVFSGCKKSRKEERLPAIVREFRAGQKPRNKHKREEFFNLKAEAGYELRRLFVEGNIIIPPDIARNYPQLIKELGAMKTELIGDKKKVVDPGILKDDPAEQKSPDFYDALVLATFKSQGITTL